MYRLNFKRKFEKKKRPSNFGKNETFFIICIINSKERYNIFLLNFFSFVISEPLKKVRMLASKLCNKMGPHKAEILALSWYADLCKAMNWHHLVWFCDAKAALESINSSRLVYLGLHHFSKDKIVLVSMVFTLVYKGI